jgi:hypothetical protein
MRLIRFLGYRCPIWVLSLVPFFGTVAFVEMAQLSPASASSQPETTAQALLARTTPTLAQETQDTEVPTPNAPGTDGQPTDGAQPTGEAQPTDGTQPPTDGTQTGEEAAPADATGEGGTGGTTNVLQGPTAGEDEVVTIPRSSAIIVSFPAELILDPNRKHNVPITLPLLQPIVDKDGQIVAPAKSLVNAQIKAMKGGDLIEVTSVVVGGRVIPINALGTLVPAQNKPEDVANPIVGSPGRLNNVLTTLQQASTFTNQLSVNFDNRPRRLNGFDVADLAIALGAGLTAPVPKIPPAFVNITQGTVYILTLASPVTIPKRLVETGIQIRESLGEEGVIPAAQ